MWQQIVNSKKGRYGIVVVLVILALTMIVKGGGEQDEVMPEITLESTKQMDVELQLPMSEVEKAAMDNKFLGEDVEMISLEDVSSGQATGAAWRYFDSEGFYLKVEVSQLIKVEKGFFYEVWLVGKDGFFSAGRIGDMSGSGELYFTDEKDQSEFRGVVVTLEEEDGVEAPGPHILEGSF